MRLPGCSLDFTHGEQKGDAVELESARGEAERVGRRSVEPLRVVDHDEERLLLSDGRKEAQQRCPDGEPVALGSWSECQAAQDGRLMLGDVLEVVDDRSAQIQQARELELRLGLEPRRLHDDHRLRQVGGVAQQRGLPDAGLAGEHEHAASPRRAPSRSRSMRRRSGSRPSSRMTRTVVPPADAGNRPHTLSPT